MSIIKVDAVVNESGGATATINGYTPTESNMAGRNRIINGDMKIDQRNAGAAVTANASYPVDRWIVYSPAGSFSAQKSTSIIPESHTNSLGFTVVSAGSPSGTQGANLGQYIEGFNVSDLGWGSAAAKTVTVSFWVRASIAGTYCFAVQNNAVDRSYVSEYTVSSANIWQQINITIAGDTTGTWLTTNGAGLKLWWDFNSGSDNSTGSADTWLAGSKKRTTNQTNLVGTSGATFYITGVQLEAGSVATPFERRFYGQELALCQRYYQQIGSVTGVASQATAFVAAVQFFVPMRTTPTVSATAVLSITDTFAADFTQSSISVSFVNGNRVNNLGGNFNMPNFSGMTTGRVHVSVPTAYSNGIVVVSAEL
jgi:hypothetical protein